VHSDAERWETALKVAKRRANPSELRCIQHYDFPSAAFLPIFFYSFRPRDKVAFYWQFQPRTLHWSF
jgi:hypothetical protein